jgi:hypothetical protein
MPRDIHGDDAAYLWDLCKAIDDLLLITVDKCYKDLENDRLF